MPFNANGKADENFKECQSIQHKSTELRSMRDQEFALRLHSVIVYMVRSICILRLRGRHKPAG